MSEAIQHPERDPTLYAADKKPAEIERDIAQTRTSLTDTLEALEQKLAPRNILEKGLDMVRDSMDGEGGSSRIGEVIRDNPVPMALIGMGLGWLLLQKSGAADYAGRRISDADLPGRVKGLIGRGEEEQYGHAWTKQEHAARTTTASHERARSGGTSYELRGSRAEGSSGGVGSYVSGASDAVGDAARGAGGYVSGAAGSAADAARGAAGYVGETGRHVWDSAGEYAGYAGRQLSNVGGHFGTIMRDYPLAVGALGFIAGAIVAASLPSTRMEDEWVGDTRDDLWRQAEEAGRDVFDRASEVARTATDSAVEAAREAVHQVGGTVEDAARDAVNKATEATRQAAEKQGFAGDKPKA